MARRPIGIILFEGPSALTGEPIAVILTGLVRSKNRKTGAMLQTYVIRTDEHPAEAVKTGRDGAVCGTGPGRCPLAGGNGCYVVMGHGPTSVFAAYKRGSYIPAPVTATAATRLVRQLGGGRPIRLGTYGDPAAAPTWVWKAAVAGAPSRTGYTHQWRTAGHLRDLCMASVHTLAEAAEAQAAGWRTFRTGPESAAPGEVLCPASDEAGRRTTCDRCKLCGGAEVKARSIYIPLHGGGARKALLAIGEKTA